MHVRRYAYMSTHVGTHGKALRFGMYTCKHIMHEYAYVYTYMHTHVHVPDVTFAAMPAEARANAVREAWRIVVFHKLEQSPFDAICRDSLALECVCVCVCVCV
jgi:hypothetical protein